MKIDKSRFLLLTTTLAATATALVVATACNTTSTSTDNDGGTPVNPDSGNSTDAAGNSEGGGDGGGDAGACLGTDQTAPFCGPEVEGMDSGVPAKCTTECDSVSALFKGGVAAEISACLDKLPDPTQEGACNTGLPGCVTDAVAKACDDPTAAEFCATTCGADSGVEDAGFTQRECEAVAKALSTQGRETFTNCAAESGCGFCFDLASKGQLQ